MVCRENMTGTRNPSHAARLRPRGLDDVGVRPVGGAGGLPGRMDRPGDEGGSGEIDRFRAP